MLPALAFAADLQWTVLLTDRTESRVRESAGPSFGLDLATSAGARLEGRTRRTALTLSYTPTVTLRGLETGGTFELFQAADLALSRTYKRWSLGATESASYGDFNYTDLTQQSENPSLPKPSPQALPATVTLRYGSSRTGLYLRWTGRRATASLVASYAIAGGFDDAARKLVPATSTPRVDASFARDLTRRDAVITEAVAQANDATAHPCDPATGGPPPAGTPLPAACSPSSQIVEGREAWSRRLSRHAELRVALGAAYFNARIDTSKPYASNVVPTGYVTLAAEPPLGRTERPRIELGARLSPLLDVRYGVVDPRLEAWAQWGGHFGRTALTMRVSWLRSVPPTSLDVSAVSVTSEASRAIGRRFDVGTGVRGFWQTTPTQSPVPVVFVTYFLSLAWHEPRIKL